MNREFLEAVHLKVFLFLDVVQPVLSHKVVAMLHLCSLWHFVTVLLRETFYRRETDVQANGMTCMKSLRKSMVEQIVNQIPTPCLTTKPVSLLLFLPCFIFPFYSTVLLLSSSLMSSSLISPRQLKHMVWMPYCKPLPSNFLWFSVYSIRHSHSSHSCRSQQQQYRDG